MMHDYSIRRTDLQSKYNINYLISLNLCYNLFVVLVCQENVMKLYSYSLCPFSRAIRVLLNENAVEYVTINARPQDELINFKTESEWIHMPVLVTENRKHPQISGAGPILLYLEDNKFIPSLSFSEKCEVIRICERFNTFFFADVSWKIIYEKVLKSAEGGRSPDSSAIRSAIGKIKQYMDEVAWLIDRRNWLAGNNFSFADITAASHISCIDYLGAITWNNYETAKEWYMRVKCRPSFQPLLNDRVAGVQPSATYSLFDF